MQRRDDRPFAPENGEDHIRDQGQYKRYKTRQHPTSFQKIFLEFVVTSGDVKDADIKKAIKLAEESVCPVWAMVKGNAEIVTEYKIIAE
jgi:putative redox protein